MTRAIAYTEYLAVGGPRHGQILAVPTGNQWYVDIISASQYIVRPVGMQDVSSTGDPIVWTHMVLLWGQLPPEKQQATLANAVMRQWFYHGTAQPLPGE